MHRGYWGETGAQIHYRELAPQTKTDNPPLLCLPPSPHSGLYFATVMPLLNEKRRVVAIDYPGFGGSDPLTGEASIEVYAQSLKSMVETFGPVDVLGFHSGNLVALELGLICPDKVSKIIMVDVPFFNVETRKKYHGMIVKPVPVPKTTLELDAEFEKQVTKRLTDLTSQRAYDLWVEILRSGTRKNSAFHAAFTYDCEAKFAELDKHVTVIASESGLLEPSRAAVKALKTARLIERLDITSAVFEVGAGRPIAEAILKALTV